MLQLSDLTLEDIFLKITMGDGMVVGSGEENASVKKEKVRINLKLDTEQTDDDGDDAQETAEAPAQENNENGGQK